MFKEGPSNTALITAAARALENERNDKLFSDPYSKLLAGEDGMRLLMDFGESFTLAETIRTKFFDDAITEAIKSGKKQFVALGSGLDTRPYRIEFPKDAIWMEVDFGPILEYKRKILKDERSSAKSLIDIPSDVAKLGADDFVSKGFNPNEPSMWIAEGLVPYLNDQQVGNLLSLISKLSKKGSEFVITCPNKAAMEKNEVTRHRNEFMAKINANWIFSGCDDPGGLFGKYGYSIDAVFVGHAKAHYGVLPWPAVEDLPKEFPKEWFVKGVKI